MDSIFKRAMKSANYDPAKATGFVSDDILRQMAANLAEIGEPIDTPSAELDAISDIALARREYIKKKNRNRS